MRTSGRWHSRIPRAYWYEDCQIALVQQNSGNKILAGRVLGTQKNIFLLAWPRILDLLVLMFMRGVARAQRHHDHRDLPSCGDWFAWVGRVESLGCARRCGGIGRAGLRRVGRGAGCGGGVRSAAALLASLRDAKFSDRGIRGYRPQGGLDPRLRSGIPSG